MCVCVCVRACARKGEMVRSDAYVLGMWSWCVVCVWRVLRACVCVCVRACVCVCRTNINTVNIQMNVYPL